ncbi:glyoxalase superfamily protein [Sulfitobacter sp. S190]|uniref:glyoxalase superfamily protein n=1 Tax=Sulfitobacter sp. S190 TaxID=2867022 RepID=UPI0021A2FF4E|nr:glyoxalase superfamily protein [Sulfitobacter sp. S190]UWR21305.1 hypothetical protein K3756_11350 [Sulfitobacter sp. S190]
MTPQFPNRSVLKAQAKRLRADLAERGQTLTHAQSLETIAHQWGMRDWNTLSARAAHDDTPNWHPGQRVQGRYLGHAFTGVVKSAGLRANGLWSVSLRFDEAIDVVKSTLFSAHRRQVNATLNAQGRTPQKTSDGQPHLVVEPA